MRKQGYPDHHTVLSWGAAASWSAWSARSSPPLSLFSRKGDPDQTPNQHQLRSIFSLRIAKAVTSYAHSKTNTFLDQEFRPMSLKLIGLICIVLLSSVDAQDRKEKAEEKKTERKADFSVAVKGDEQTLSDEFTVRSGKWQVAEKPKCFQVAGAPLVESRIEFGPEYRETGVALTGEVWARSGKRVYPRMGFGLFGKNGFFLRLFPAQKRVELVRRGVVLARNQFTWKSGEHYLMELSVQTEEDNWRVTGRVWPKSGKVPAKPQISYLAWSDELLFPLAGRSSAVATPFAGLPVSFNRVEIFKKAGEPAPGVEDEKEDASQ